MKGTHLDKLKRVVKNRQIRGFFLLFKKWQLPLQVLEAFFEMGSAILLQRVMHGFFTGKNIIQPLPWSNGKISNSNLLV